MLDSDEEMTASKPVDMDPRRYHVPSGALTQMVANMSDDWASSEDELNFAEESDSEGQQPIHYAQSSLSEQNDSGSLEFAESSAVETDSDREVAGSDKTSSGLDFAESSAVESEDEVSSQKTSSALEFAESSAVESDSAKSHGSSSGLGWAESSDYD